MPRSRWRVRAIQRLGGAGQDRPSIPGALDFAWSLAEIADIVILLRDALWMVAVTHRRPVYHRGNCESRSSSGLKSISFPTRTFTRDKASPRAAAFSTTTLSIAARKSIRTHSKKPSNQRERFYLEQRKTQGPKHWLEFAYFPQKLFNYSLPSRADLRPKGGETKNGLYFGQYKRIDRKRTAPIQTQSDQRRDHQRS